MPCRFCSFLCLQCLTAEIRASLRASEEALWLSNLDFTADLSFSAFLSLSKSQSTSAVATQFRCPYSSDFRHISQMPGASLTTDMSFHVSPGESRSNPKCLSYARESGHHLHQRQVADDSVPISHCSVCFLKPLLVLTNCHRLVLWEANSEIRLLCRMFLREKSEEPHSWKGGEGSRPGQEKVSSWDTASIKTSGDSLARMEQNGLLQLPQLVLCEPLHWV